MRFPWLLDVILGLLIVAALPLAIVAIPNTVSVVRDLLPDGIDRVGLMRAHGLALPAMMLTVPLAAVALRRMNVAHILVGGLTLLALADAAGGFADSTFVVGVLRVLHGIGAGVVIPATLVAAWDRAPALRGVWTGMLALSLLAAQALALWPLDGAENWKITLQPYPMLSGIGLGLAALYLLVWAMRGESPSSAPRAAERNRLLLAAVPAAGIAVLAISSASDSWRPGLVVLVAVLSVASLLALASIGTFEGPAGRSLAYSTVAVGVVVLPSMAQLTSIEIGGHGGPGLKGLWLPFLIAGVLAIAAALGVVFFGGTIKWLTPAGLLTIVLGLCAVRLMVPATDGFTLVVPFTLLAVGAAVALTAALRQTGAGAALFALALCFPGVLSGYLLGTGLQVFVLQDVKSAQEVVDGFVTALHLWALIGGFLVVAVIVLAGLLGRRSGAAVEAAVSGTADAAAADSAVRDAVPSQERADIARESGSVEVAGVRGETADADAESTPEVSAEEHAVVVPDVADDVVPDVAADDPADVEDTPDVAADSPAPESAAVPDPAQEVRDAGDADGVASGAPPAARPDGSPGERVEGGPSTTAIGVKAEVLEALQEEDRPTGEVPRIDVSTPGNGAESAASGDATGPIPVVPPPTQSPEDTAEP